MLWLGIIFGIAFTHVYSRVYGPKIAWIHLNGCDISGFVVYIGVLK